MLGALWEASSSIVQTLRLSRKQNGPIKLIENSVKILYIDGKFGGKI